MNLANLNVEHFNTGQLKSTYNPKHGLATEFVPHWIRDHISTEMVLQGEQTAYGKWSHKFYISHKNLLYAQHGTMVVPMGKLFFLDLCFLEITMCSWKDSDKTFIQNLKLSFIFLTSKALVEFVLLFCSMEHSFL